MICVVLPVLLAAALAVQPPRPFADERHLLDRRLETLRRILPDGPTPAADILHVRDLAETARLARVEIQARAPVESGTRGEVALDVSALGGYEEVDRFFQKVALSQRLVDVERLTLTGTTEDVVQLAAVLRFPYWPPRAPLPPPPESPWGRPAGVPRPALDAFRHDRQVALAKSDVIAARRRSRRSPRLFLSELAAAARDRPVVLGYAELKDDLDFTIRGLAVGEGPLRGFESRLERGFFRMSDFLIAKQGACHRFEAHGKSPVAGPDAELPVPMEDPFEPDDTPCRVDRDRARTILVKGRTPTAKDPGRGPLTLRLRDLDLTDVFQALATVGAAGFVVDDDVVGRVSVEVTRATLDETLAAIRKAAGVEIAGGGPVWRVSTSRQPPRYDTATGGPPATFALKRTEVRDLLAAMADVDPGLAVLGPSGFLGRVSVWTNDVPLFAVRGAVLDAAGLTERTEEGTRVVARETGPKEAPAPVARSGPEPRLGLRPEELTFHEFELAGVASGGGAFVAFAYSPTGRLNAYRAGDRLADAVVRSVESTDVVLETTEGPLQIAVPPLPD
jgi:Pilus assembly protein, PilO